MRVGLVFLFSLSACCGSVAFGVPSADIGQPPFFAYFNLVFIVNVFITSFDNHYYPK